VPVTDLYPAYLGWSAANGDKHPLSKALFDERLRKLGRKQDRVRPDGGGPPSRFECGSAFG
jgi:phage/plasmid-associated DNA primase